MARKLVFTNIKSGETIGLDVVSQAPLIDAFIESSDMATNGPKQDFGWRITPHVKVELEERLADNKYLSSLARALTKPVDSILASDILGEIVRDMRDDEALEAERLESNPKFQEQYDKIVENLRKEKK